ncbi:hypothetical protein [Planococcus sp. YIM B11945]|uniref:hypothetical protein n=1 Tax=Planococcus sp. YIM B11945 TaxID=3435410 RepID=UPI003D7E4528
MTYILWFLYAALLVTFAVKLLNRGGYKNYVYLLDLAVTVIALIGLFGYVTGNELFTPFVWQLVFVGALLWDVLFFFFYKGIAFDAEAADGPFLAVFSGVFMVVLLSPLYFALFQYAF